MNSQYANLLICSNQNNLIIDNFTKLSMDNMEQINENLLNLKRKSEKTLLKEKVTKGSCSKKSNKLVKEEVVTDKLGSSNKFENNCITNFTFKVIKIII